MFEVPTSYEAGRPLGRATMDIGHIAVEVDLYGEVPTDLTGLDDDLYPEITAHDDRTEDDPYEAQPSGEVGSPQGEAIEPAAGEGIPAQGPGDDDGPPIPPTDAQGGTEPGDPDEEARRLLAAAGLDAGAQAVFDRLGEAHAHAPEVGDRRPELLDALRQYLTRKESGDSSFLPSYPHESMEEVIDLRNRLVEQLAAGGLSATEVAAAVRDDPALAVVYPDKEVTPQFQAERPNILFMPPLINERQQTQDYGYRALQFADTTGLRGEAITSPEQLAGWLVDIRDNLVGNVSPPCLKSLMNDVFSGYLQNLELLRLTQNPNGRLVRYTTTPKVDSPDVLVPPELVVVTPPERSTFQKSLHPDLRDFAANSWVTTWSREDMALGGEGVVKPDGKEVVKPHDRRHRIETTVGRLEVNNTISLDFGRDMSLVAIRRPPIPH